MKPSSPFHPAKFNLLIAFCFSAVTAIGRPAIAETQEVCVQTAAGEIVCGKPVPKPSAPTAPSPAPKPSPNARDNEVRTYVLRDNINGIQTVGLRITGNRQHVCNVLLPRGPGIGGSFFYPSEAAMWKTMRCEELYCNLTDVTCRISLRSQWAKPDP